MIEILLLLRVFADLESGLSDDIVLILEYLSGDLDREVRS